MARLFKYTREDFGKLPVQVLHMDLNFDIFHDHTDVVSHLKVKTVKPLKKLTLNAKNLTVSTVSCDACPVLFDYQKDLLIITFEKTIKKNKVIIITTQTTCRPTKNTLEGLYYDETPPGAPPTQITQCQQWGFQRIVPCIDDMTAKCIYTTTIIADEKYTNIITNGDLVQERKKIAPGRVQVKYDNTKTPMAPYLFFLGVGTYTTFKKELEYPDGKTFTLELLVPPKSEPERAEKALELLAHGILWIHLFTGPDTYPAHETKTQIWNFLLEREQMKKDEKKLATLRKKIKQLTAPLKLGYQYTGTVYREIGMQNSDFGGMENVGNTTIVTNRIMPFAHMTDRAFEYLIAVKTHEFYHNLNGSEVTGHSPFEIWLNEAVTVFIEHAHIAFVFGEDYARLSTVLGILSPERGTLSQDAGAASLPIEPDGFNDPNELITSITYVKAPEFVRMIETLIGKENFVKGLHLYHTTYKHRNATTTQWINCMEKASGYSLQAMAKGWLKKTKYPELKVTPQYKEKNKECTLDLKQNGNWQFPFSVALHDQEGNIIAEKIIRVQKKQQKISFAHLPKPAFLSLNRGYSFYGKVHYTATEDELLLQVRKGNDVVCRFLAFQELMNQEKEHLLKNKHREVSSPIIALYYELFTSQKLMQQTGPQIISIFESVEHEKYAHCYQDLYDVKKKILNAIAKKYQKELEKKYATCDHAVFHGVYLEKTVQEIKNREIKNTALALLSTLDTPLVHAMIKKQFNTATNATDKVVAFRLYLNSSAPDRFTLMHTYQEEACKNLVSWETFLLVIGGNDNTNFVELIKKIEASPSFRIEQASDQRALYGSFALNKKKSLLTKEGRTYLKECILKLAPINEYSALYLLKTLDSIDKMEPQHHVPLMQILAEIFHSVDAEKNPSLHNTAKRMILNMPRAKKAYEKEHKKKIFS
ncbi:M1 family metallopeptidase [Candidatus Woesearchaeota archaeon]|nr:M1 family metallopeptidase [Candidatus Woesearchaeota archaeon]